MIPIISTRLLLAAPVLDFWPSFFGGSLGVVIIVGLYVIRLVNRWRKQPESASLSPSDQLSQYREMFEAGTLTKEEYEQLRAVLSNRLRSDLQMPPATPPVNESLKPPPSSGSHPGPEDPPSSPEGIRPA